MWLTFSMVAQSMEAGTAIVSKIPIDPTVDGVLAPGQFLLWGAIGRLMTTLFLSASGFAIWRGRLMPAWLAWLAFLIALINLVFVPAMFFGYDAVSFTAPSGGVRRQWLPSWSSGGSSSPASSCSELPPKLKPHPLYKDEQFRSGPRDPASSARIVRPTLRTAARSAFRKE